MSENKNIEWLLENGSPAIRLRTEKDLLGCMPSQQVIDDLLAFSMTQKWMSLLQPDPRFANIHGSKPECLENIGGKLREMGFTVNMSPQWTQKLQPYVDHLNTLPSFDIHLMFSNLLMVAPLITIGFAPTAFLDLAVDHLSLTGDFCRRMNFDPFIDPDTFGGIPTAFSGKKLLDPATNSRLPTIWDLYLLAYMPRSYREREISEAEAAILNYVLTDQYQTLPEGYGILYDPDKKRYYSHGWNVYLPNWFGKESTRPLHEASYVQRLELFSNFRQARTRKWFQYGVKHLMSFRTDQGTYRFPSSYLKEGTSGYYVTGTYMRLEDNRRRKIALELDSTFRIELIRKRAGFTG